jgi:hypothetical protein
MKDAIEVSIIFHEGNRMMAVPKQSAVPLTDEQIRWHWSNAHNDTTDRMAFEVFARAIEAAHGITVAPEKGQP